MSPDYDSDHYTQPLSQMDALALSQAKVTSLKAQLEMAQKEYEDLSAAVAAGATATATSIAATTTAATATSLPHLSHPMGSSPPLPLKPAGVHANFGHFQSMAEQLAYLLELSRSQATLLSLTIRVYVLLSTFLQSPVITLNTFRNEKLIL
jgi:hypothetical protein